ncbi:hypothetical protein VO54_01417 [Elizabethkingia miricola]|nr:hypothetical protein VO54_01417 [Elizabethkingia miricola]
MPEGYGGGMRKHRNALVSVGHLSHSGFIFLNNKIMTPKKTAVIVNGKEVDLTGYFETLAREPNQSEFYTKIGVSSYQEIGYLQNSILSVCRQALETGEQIADGLDFSRLLELVQKLIPYAELELLTKIQQSE